MSAITRMVLANGPAFIAGLALSQKKSLQFMRTELKRGAQRLKKTFIREELQGPPGIKAGPLAKGKNIWTFVKGDSLKTLSASIGISRILHVHEQGLMIEAKRGGYLYLRENKGKASEQIIAVVPRVTIPARLKFRPLVAREAPAIWAKVVDEGRRAIQVTMSDALKKSAGFS